MQAFKLARQAPIPVRRKRGKRRRTLLSWVAILLRELRDFYTLSRISTRKKPDPQSQTLTPEDAARQKESGTRQRQTDWAEKAAQKLFG